MQPEFLDNVGTFLKRLKHDSVRFENDSSFERLMGGLSDGSIDFRWNFGGRLRTRERTHISKPNLMWLRWLVSAPFIYGMALPILALDVVVSIYQAICFRLWQIPQVLRSKHIIIDRHRLEYLAPWQKLHCLYCGYANGVFAYARMIAGETERYWCPVKHEESVSSPHEFYIEFAEYDDPSGWEALHSGGITDWENPGPSGNWGRN